jgi:hypothetical protein
MHFPFTLRKTKAAESDSMKPNSPKGSRLTASISSPSVTKRLVRHTTSDDHDHDRDHVHVPTPPNPTDSPTQSFALIADTSEISSSPSFSSSSISSPFPTSIRIPKSVSSFNEIPSSMESQNPPEEATVTVSVKRRTASNADETQAQKGIFDKSESAPIRRNFREWLNRRRDITLQSAVDLRKFRKDSSLSTSLREDDEEKRDEEKDSDKKGEKSGERVERKRVFGERRGEGREMERSRKRVPSLTKELGKEGHRLVKVERLKKLSSEKDLSISGRDALSDRSLLSWRESIMVIFLPGNSYTCLLLLGFSCTLFRSCYLSLRRKLE